MDGSGWVSRLSPRTPLAAPDTTGEGGGWMAEEAPLSGTTLRGRRRGTATCPTSPAPWICRTCSYFQASGWLWAPGQRCPCPGRRGRVSQFPSNTFPSRRIFHKPHPTSVGSGCLVTRFPLGLVCVQWKGRWRAWGAGEDPLAPGCRHPGRLGFGVVQPCPRAGASRP